MTLPQTLQTPFYRQQLAAQYHQLNWPPTELLSLAEQAMCDRLSFELAMTGLSRFTETTATPPTHFTVDSTTAFLTKITPDLGNTYQWVIDRPHDFACQVLNEIIDYRDHYQAEHDNITPADSLIYRHYRLAHETDETHSEATYRAFLLVEALMKGNAKGTLPIFEPDCS